MKIKEIKINQSQNIWATLLDYLWKNNKNLFNELSKYIKEIETEQNQKEELKNIEDKKIKEGV